MAQTFHPLSDKDVSNLEAKRRWVREHYEPDTQEKYQTLAIERQKSFRATLANGVWLVGGSLPKRMLGGVALAEISKKDGRVLRVSHGK